MCACVIIRLVRVDTWTILIAAAHMLWKRLQVRFKQINPNAQKIQEAFHKPQLTATGSENLQYNQPQSLHILMYVFSSDLRKVSKIWSKSFFFNRVH